MNNWSKGVDPRLVAIFDAAQISYYSETGNEVIVTEGKRTLAKQTKLVAAGASRTLKSKHLTGRAIDVAIRVRGTGVRWDWPLYRDFARHMKDAAKGKLPIVWGGDWKSFKDGPHYEIKEGA